MTAASRPVADGRLLLLLHGFLGSARNLGTLAHRLAQADARLAVRAVDLPGHGAGPPLPPGADTATLARAVLDGLGAPGASGRLLLVGHSLGGRVALRLAGLAPAAVGHVTLLDVSPSPLSTQGDVSRVLAALAAAPARAASREPFRSHLRSAGLAEPVVEWLLLNLEPDDAGVRWRIDRPALAALHARIAGEDLWPLVEGPRAWTLNCVRGGASPYVGGDDARRLETAGCSVATVPGAGHFLHAERPDEVARLVLAGLPSPSA